MLPEGFYHGKGPWWLRGWEGKFFDSSTLRGYNVFTGGKKKLTFWYIPQEEGTWRIVYDSMLVPFEDVMVLDGDTWRGKIYLGKLPIGTFELRK